MKSIILARVSTEEQMSEGQSIPAQLDKARKYANKKGFEVKSEYQFDESSIKDKRTKFEVVISEIRRSAETVALIVETVDRLQRSFKESVMLDELRKKGKVEIHFIRENLVIHQNSNSSEIQRWDLAVFVAKSYVLQISDNVKRSIDQKLKNGEMPGRAPYGYKNTRDMADKPDIVSDSLISTIVIKMYEWYGSEVFSMEGVRVKVKEEYGVNLAKGKVDAILKNPFYYGEMLIKGKLYPHKYETLVTRQLWERVQSIKAGHRKKPCKPGGLPYLYRGLLRCGHDGHSFTPEKKKKKSGLEFVYYHCTEYSGKHGTAWIREEEITNQFKEIIDRINIPEELAENIAKTLRASHEGKKEYHQEIFNGLMSDYKRLENRLEKMYEHLLDGRLTEEEYDKRSQQYRSEQIEIRAKLDNLEKADEDYYVSAKYLLKLCQKAPELFESSEPKVKRQILKTVLQNCIVNDATLCPDYRKPFDVLAKSSDCQSWGE